MRARTNPRLLCTPGVSSRTSFTGLRKSCQTVIRTDDKFDHKQHKRTHTPNTHAHHQAHTPHHSDTGTDADTDTATERHTPRFKHMRWSLQETATTETKRETTDARHVEGVKMTTNIEHPIMLGKYGHQNQEPWCLGLHVGRHFTPSLIGAPHLLYIRLRVWVCDCVLDIFYDLDFVLFMFVFMFVCIQACRGP